MKVKNLKSYNSLKYFLLKNNKNAQKILDLTFFERNLKQFLKIIYEYHTQNKQILFIGFPKFKYKRILQKTKHIFMPVKVFKEGFFSNNLSFAKDLKNKPDLIIFFNSSKNFNILNELIKFKIPIMFFNITGNVKTRIYYKLINNIEFNKNLVKFYITLIFSVLKISF